MTAQSRTVAVVLAGGIGVRVGLGIPKQLPPAQPPLQTLVLNVTNQCNLACTYCYEYGEDRITEPAGGGRPRLMSEETARASVDFMLRESGSSPVAHLTFFGGETLLNYPVVRATLAQVRERLAGWNVTLPHVDHPELGRA